MALYESKLQANVKDVAFNATNTKIAALHEDTVSVLRYDTLDSDPLVSEVVALHSSDGQATRQICFGDDETIYVLGTSLDSGCTTHYMPRAKEFKDFNRHATRSLLLPSSSLGYPYILSEFSGTSEITGLVVEEGKEFPPQASTIASTGIMHAEMIDVGGNVSRYTRHAPLSSFHFRLIVFNRLCLSASSPTGLYTQKIDPSLLTVPRSCSPNLISF